MSKHVDLDFSGPDAVTSLENPVNGLTGLSGAKGTKADNGWFHCDQQATAGGEGIHGDSAPPAPGGANGNDAFDVIITCDEFVGDELVYSSNGGKGADGSSGGQGGGGGDGGNAGLQKGHCKQFASGGLGGYAGQGGNAGRGGNGGNAGDVVVVTGSAIKGLPVTGTSTGGGVGENGNPGLPGKPGQGGMNSDQTMANAGATNGPGAYATPPSPGKGGSIHEAISKAKPASYLRINVTQHKLS